MALSFLRSLWSRRDPERGSPSSGTVPLPVAQPLAKQAAWKLTVVGCGDAFGAGGRLQSSYHLETPQDGILLDCGATTLIGLERENIDPNGVGTILITHLHGDHFSGLAWWLMHAHYVTGRAQPLTIAGPAGLYDRLQTTTEALFPGSSAIDTKFPVTYVEYADRVPLKLGDVAVTPFEVHHPSGAPAYAVRVESGGRSVSFSGDTEWMDSLVSCAAGTDLMIIDCFGFETDVGFHMSWKTISSRLGELTARRIMLTHMGPEMLRRRGEISNPRVLQARDGLVVDIPG